MNIKVFNLSIAIGWLMFLAGSLMRDPAWGLMVSGVLLLLLVVVAARLAGLFQPTAGEER